MPDLRSIESRLYKRRRRQFPALPSTRGATEITDGLRQTEQGEELLIHSSEENIMLIFCSPISLRILSEADTLTMDGTFDCVPLLNTHLFTIHAFKDEQLLPLVYCLTSSKDRSTYKEIFRVLKSKCQQQQLILDPSVIISDCESDFISAVRDEFLNVQHQGCYFHFTQAV